MCARNDNLPRPRPQARTPWRGRLWAAGIVLLIGGCGSTVDTASTGSAAAPGAPYRITGAGGKTSGPLQITRIELTFANQQAEATVPQDARLHARAVIRTDGNGPLRATWLVDGRPLETVALNLSLGSTVTLQTGAGTRLPTFEPGPHSVTLRVQEPAPPFPVPVIRYFVTGRKTNGN